MSVERVPDEGPIIKSEITRELSNAGLMITNTRETPETCVPLRPTLPVVKRLRDYQLAFTSDARSPVVFGELAKNKEFTS